MVLQIKHHRFYSNLVIVAIKIEKLVAYQKTKKNRPEERFFNFLNYYARAKPDAVNVAKPAVWPISLTKPSSALEVVSVPA